MSFDSRDIRPMMDVYTKDNLYLGSVLAMTPGTLPTNGKHGVERAHAAHKHVEGSDFSGEMLGPVPTQTIGNTGPIVQSARANYASQPDDAILLGHGSITVGKWYGLLGRHTIPLDAVQTVSLERVVLRLMKNEL